MSKKYTVYLTLGLRQEQKDAIQAAADAEDKPVATWIRETALLRLRSMPMPANPYGAKR